MSFDPTRYWYQPRLSLFSIVLLPFSYLFKLIIFIRLFLYQKNIFKKSKLPVPVIVVGNITVGGTGKTPFVIWLAEYLKSLGYQPGIISRGVGGKSHQASVSVTSDSSSDEVGDEALLLAIRANCPVYINPNRVAAADALLKSTNCNIIISDDGLQHYRLARDIEIVIVDGVRQFGNQQLLPAGPLREPVSRLKHVDFIVENKLDSMAPYHMALSLLKIISLDDKTTKTFADFLHTPVHAVAGIGNPYQFFDRLKINKLTLIEHIFKDHYHYHQNDLEFMDNYPIIMTEKDAVKCKKFTINNAWYVQAEANINDQFQQQLLLKLNSMEKKSHGYVEEDFSKRVCSQYPHDKYSGDGRNISRNGSTNSRNCASDND